MKNMKLKMFGKYSVSSFFYWLFKVLFMFLSVFLGFFIISTLIGNYQEFKLDGFINHCYKAYFRETVFYVRMDVIGIVSFLFPFLKYGLLFHLLVLVFKSLKNEKLIFTKKSIKYLQFFAVFNICMPLIYGLFNVLIFKKLHYLNVFPSIFNVFIGLFTIFVIAVFKQGFKIQQENNLTI